MEDNQPATWREKFWRGLDRAFTALSNAEMQCGRCHKIFLLPELLSHYQSPLPTSPQSYDLRIPVLCCQDCLVVLRKQIEQQRRLEAMNRRLARENLIVWRQNERARKAGAEATLTL